MVENPILTRYKHLAGKDGFLKLNDDAEIISFGNAKRGRIGAQKCFAGGDLYFKKFNGKVNDSYKLFVDAEILLSQVYSKLGLKSAIYVPVDLFGDKFLLSQSLEGLDTTSAGLFHEYVSKQDDGIRFGTYLVDFIFAGEKDFFSKEIIPNPAMKYFTEEALKQRLEMRVLDVAARNTDRELVNFLYGLNKQNQAQEVKLFDYEHSGYVFQHNFWYNQSVLKFHSETTSGKLYMPEFITEIKENEEASKTLNCSEFAEQLGSVDIPAVAQDIEENINYKIEPDYVEALNRSFNEVAEELSK